MKKKKTDLVIVGGGPGGYSAAFYAAQRGLDVLLVDREARLGGVCLLRGCIPSKAYLHATSLIEEARFSENRGIHFGEPSIHPPALLEWKQSIVNKMADGLDQLADQRGVEVMQGRGFFEDSKTLRVESEEGQEYFQFKRAIIATGSSAVLPSTFDLGHPKIWTSARALDFEEVPKRLLVVGGGYIGLELSTVYARLGSKVVLAEAMDSLMPGTDPELVKPVAQRLKTLLEDIRLNTKVEQVETSGEQIKTVMGSGDDAREELYDAVLVAVGRQPNTEGLGLGNTKVKLDDKGFIQTTKDMGTEDKHLFAIGDVIGGEMLAHKATREARMAVQAILGENSLPEDLLVPAIVYTDPEIAWVGLTEEEARQKKIDVAVARFPWSASGRALTYDRGEGLTKLVVDPSTDHLLGVSIVGHEAGKLIAEATVAIEMAATVEDLAMTIHPHPTLSETIMECAEAYFGTATHTISRREKAA